MKTLKPIILWVWEIITKVSLFTAILVGIIGICLGISQMNLSMLGLGLLITAGPVHFMSIEIAKDVKELKQINKDIKKNKEELKRLRSEVKTR